jgi:6,7-dimethyl-8-ribityllumazine synthase
MRGRLMGVYSVSEEPMDARGMRFGVVVARYNRAITEKLLEGAQRVLQEHGATEDHVTVVWVPGAFEVPLIAKQLSHSGRVDAVVCLGAIIRGETPHFEYVASQSAAGLMRVAVDTDVPVVFGVLTTDSVDQALARVGGATGHRGEEAALAAIEMVTLLRQLR